MKNFIDYTCGEKDFICQYSTNIWSTARKVIETQNLFLSHPLSNYDDILKVFHHRISNNEFMRINVRVGCNRKIIAK